MAKKAVTDHLGNNFVSVKEMCEYWNIERHTLRLRLNAGLSLADALTQPKKIAIDHLGNEFNSVKGMCEYWGIPYVTFKERIKVNWSIEKALTTPVKQVEHKVEYNGVHYKSVSQLATDIGIDAGYLRYHLTRGKTIDDIIAMYRSTIVYKGNTYKNIKDLANTFGINYGTLLDRLHNKKSLDEALQSRVRHNIVCIDMLGVAYNSINKISEAWGVANTTTLRRIKQGFDIEVAVISSDTMSLTHIGLDGKAYYKVKWSQDLVTARQIVEYYRPDLIDAYDKSNPTGKWNPVLKENQNN